MHNSLLIQTVAGVERPSPGHWAISRSHATITARRRALQRGTVLQASVCGALIVGDEPNPPQLTLAISGHGLGSTIGVQRLSFSASFVLPTRTGLWAIEEPTLSAESSMAATVVSARESGPRLTVVDAALRYHGVFVHGERAVAWIELYVRAVARRRRGERLGAPRVLEFHSNLDADAPRYGG